MNTALQPNKGHVRRRVRRRSESSENEAAVEAVESARENPSVNESAAAVFSLNHTDDEWSSSSLVSSCNNATVSLLGSGHSSSTHSSSDFSSSSSSSSLQYSDDDDDDKLYCTSSASSSSPHHQFDSRSSTAAAVATTSREKSLERLLPGALGFASTGILVAADQPPQPPPQPDQQQHQRLDDAKIASKSNMDEETENKLAISRRLNHDASVPVVPIDRKSPRRAKSEDDRLRPGAFFVASAKSDGNVSAIPPPSCCDLNSVDADVMAKWQRRSRGGGAVRVVADQLDAKIASKIASSTVSSNRRSRPASDRKSPRRAKSEDSCRPGAFFVAKSWHDDEGSTTLPSCDLNSVESDMLTKQRSHGGVVVADQLDAKIARKMKRNEEQMANLSVCNGISGPVSDRRSPRRVKSAESLPGAFFVSKSLDDEGSTTLPSCDLNSAESDVLTKQRSRGGVVVTERLDDKIANKLKRNEKMASSSESSRRTAHVPERQSPRRVKSEDSCRPGAFFVAAIPDVDPTTPPSGDLGSVDADSLAKRRSRSIVATDQLDNKIARKMRSEDQLGSSSMSCRQSAPVSERQSPRRAKSAESLPGAYFVATALDDDGSTTPPPPSVHLHTDDADSLAKQRSRGVVVAERLDDKIARKTRSDVQMTSASMSNRTPGSVSDRQSPRRVKSAESRPGAYYASNNGSMPTPCCDLSTAESDIIAKQRSRAVVVTERLDAKIESKMRNEEQIAGSSVSSRRSAPVSDRQSPRRAKSAESLPGAYFAPRITGNGSMPTPCCDLSTAESDVVAKQRSRAVVVTNQLDDKIARKMRREERASTSVSSRRSEHVPDRLSPRRTKSEESCRPGAFFATAISDDGGSTTLASCDLNSVESDILAKQRSRAVVVAERLDSKIASKMRGEEPESTSTTNSTSLPDSVEKKASRQIEEVRPGAFFASTISDDATTPPSCDLSSVESDILAKQRSRVVVVTEHLDAKIANKMKGEDPLADSSLSNRRSGIDSEIQSEESRPGAFLAAAMSASVAQTHSCDLSTVESDILTKLRSRVVVVTEQLDAKIASKMRGDEPVCSTAGSTPNHLTDDRATLRPGSVMESVNTMIAAKIRGDSQPTMQAELRNLEDAVQSKIQGIHSESSLVDPAHAALQSLESRIAAKVEQRNDTASSMVSSLEQGLQNLEYRIQAKMNGNASLLVANTDACESSHQQLCNTEDEIRAKSNDSSVALALESLDSTIASNISGDAISRKDDETQSPSHVPRPYFRREPSECLSIFSCDSIKSPRRQGWASNSSIQSLRHFDDVEESESEFQRESSNRDLTELYDVELGEHGGPEDEDLVVAFAVEEDENDMFFPSAVEYNPDAKPPIHRNRRFRLYSFLLYSAVVIGIAGAVVGILLGDSDPLPPALPDRSTLGIREYVERLVGVEALNDVTNPYRKALEWIQFVDPMALTPDSVKFTQRFLIAYFYFSTSVDKNWANGCEPSNVESVTCTFRYNGAVHVDEPNEDEAKRWLSAEDECTWAGVYCDRSGQVDKLDFSGSNMTAPSFPEGLASFPQLQHLALNNGEIKGTLPAAVGDMKHLHGLELAGNAFQGTIPDNWYNSRSLRNLNVGRNLLTGTINDAIIQWKDLTSFMFNSNQLTGRIPDNLPIGIVWLYLDNNLLVGSIPASLGRLSQMTQLFLFQNQLTGKPPPQLGSLENLLELCIQGNELTGSFPDEWSKLRQLAKLEIASNKLTGNILPKLVNMTVVEFVRIDNNQFTGTFPREFSALKDMKKLDASGNAFSGQVGPRICNLMKPKNNEVTTKSLVELKLDCAVQSNGVAEISCPCCTHCCDGDGTKCSVTGFEG